MHPDLKITSKCKREVECYTPDSVITHGQWVLHDNERFITHETVDPPVSVLQIRMGYRDNLRIISHFFSIKNIFCDPSLELSWRDSSNEGSQHMF